MTENKLNELIEKAKKDIESWLLDLNIVGVIPKGFIPTGESAT